MLAAVVAPLFGVFYTPGKPSPRAAFLSTLVGVITRVVLEFALPKDESLILPFNEDEFYTYGPAASTAFPTFFDNPAEEVWDPTDEAQKCDNSTRWEDYTGVDSLAALAASVLVFVAVTALEGGGHNALFTFNGLEGYEKDLGHHEGEGEKGTKEVADSDEVDEKADEAEA